MRHSDGRKQPRNLVRAGVAWLCLYFAFSGFGLAQSGFTEAPPSSYTVCSTMVGGGCRTYNSLDGAREMNCVAAAFTIRDSVRYESTGTGAIGDDYKCKVTATIDDVGGTRIYAFTQGVDITCPDLFSWDPFNGDNNPNTGVCKKRADCVPAVESCYMSSEYAISSVAATVCVNNCVVAQTLGSPEIRYFGGVQAFYYSVTKAKTSVKCSVVGGGSVVACNAGPPAAQNPCELPDAATNVSCGGGSGCPAGSTVLANGACTPNDGNAPCPAQSYRVDGHGSCVPFPTGGGGSGAGTGGGGTGAAGTGGSGGNSGSTGGAGGSGGAGSSTGGGGGGGSGGQGGGGGGGGTGGGGGSGGVGGAGGAGKEDVKCGTTGDLCQTKFQEYFDAVKEFFAGDPVLAADGKAEVLKSNSGGYEENKLTKGPVTDLSSLHLDTGGGMIGGGHSCPQSRQINFKGATVAISYQPLCDFSGYIRAVLLALCALVCARLVFGAWS